MLEQLVEKRKVYTGDREFKLHNDKNCFPLEVLSFHFHTRANAQKKLLNIESVLRRYSDIWCIYAIALAGSNRLRSILNVCPDRGAI